MTAAVVDIGRRLEYEAMTKKIKERFPRWPQIHETLDESSPLVSVLLRDRIAVGKKKLTPEYILGELKSGRVSQVTQELADLVALKASLEEVASFIDTHGYSSV